MSLPTSRNRTYAAGQMVQSGDLNDIQDGIANDTNGTVSKAAVVVDGVGGAAVAARSADSPLVIQKDSGGNVRGVVDHLAYPLTTDIIDMREDWIGTTNGAITANSTPLTGFNRWTLGVASTGNSVTSQSGSVTTPWPCLSLGLGNTNTSNLTVYLNSLFLFQALNSLVFEVDIVSITIGGTWTINVGFNGGTSTANAAYFSASNAAANWKCTTTNNSSTPTTSDSGVAVLFTTVATRLRVELHGASSPYGACARFFINAVLVATITTNQPVVGHTLTPQVYFASGDTTAARSLLVGSARFLLNRVLSAALI